MEIQRVHWLVPGVESENSDQCYAGDAQHGQHLYSMSEVCCMYESPTPPRVLFRLLEYYTSASLQLQYDTLPPWRRPERAGCVLCCIMETRAARPAGSSAPGRMSEGPCPALCPDERPKKALKSRALLQFLS